MTASFFQEEGQQLGLENVIDRELLQRLLDSFFTATKMRICLTDVNGNIVLGPNEGDSEFCSLVKSFPCGLERCQESYALAGKQATKWNEPYFFRCHAGLVAWACPILHNGTHVGNLICGQILMWQPEEFFWLEIKEAVKAFIHDDEQLMDAARKLEVVSAKQVQAAADLLHIITNYLAQSGTGIFDYQRRLRTVGSWLWEENKKQKVSQKDDREKQNRDLYDLENQFFGEIRQGNAVKAKKLLDQIILEFFTRSKGHIEVIKGLSIEFISSLARLATECGINFEKSFSYGSSKLKELEMADTTEKVVLWLVSLGYFYIDLISRNQTIDENEAVISKAVDYIQNNYSSAELSLEKVAQASFVSSAYLNRLFNKKKGCTVMEFVKNVRIEHAKRFLRQSEQTTEEIAEKVGYNSRSYFSKLFKKEVGVSPHEYRSSIFSKDTWE